MKKAIAILMTAAMLVTLGGCGEKKDAKSQVSGDGVEVKETKAPASESASPLPTVAATQIPFVESGTTSTVTTEEIPVSETKNEFEESSDTDGYKKYVDSAGKWGILLPEDAVVGDEDESGCVFMLNQNMIAVSTLDEPVELRSIEEAKQYYSILDEVKVNRFTVIYDGDDYAGCCFDYQTSIGAVGFGKYSIKGGTAAYASAVNLSDDATLNDVLRDAVNSLVVFE